MSHLERAEDEEPTNDRRGALAAVAAVGASLVLGPLLTDKAPGLWTPVLVSVGALVLIVAAALFVADLRQVHGQVPDQGEDGFDR